MLRIKNINIFLREAYLSNLQFKQTQEFSSDRKNTLLKNRIDVMRVDSFKIESLESRSYCSKRKAFLMNSHLNSYSLLKGKNINVIVASIFGINKSELFNTLNNKLNTSVQVSEWIKLQKEKDSFRNFVNLRRKLREQILFSIKVFITAALITILYRIYYYFEHDIDILEPRVTDYHIYRFR